MGSVAGSVRPSRNPGRSTTSYQGLVFKALANLEAGLYPSTSREVANSSYDETQLPFDEPSSDWLTLGEALMKTSPTWVPPAISLARAEEPAGNPPTV